MGLLVLAGCGPSQDAASGPPSPPADAPPSPPPVAAPAPAPPADFSRPLNAVGTEPFWSVTIRPEGLVFSAPDQAGITAPATAPTVSGDAARWAATGSDGMPLTVSLTLAHCSDGMSDAVHPFTAVVEAGGRTLKGCAAYATAPAG